MEAMQVIERIEELQLIVEVERDVLYVTPSSRIPDDLRPEIRASKKLLLAHYQLLRLPFPQGYQGLPEQTVVAAEAYSDWIGVADPIARKIRVLSWVLDHLRINTPIGEDLPLFYQDVKNEKHRLIHEDCDLDGRPLECGYCNIPEFVDPLDEEDA